MLQFGQFLVSLYHFSKQLQNINPKQANFIKEVDLNFIIYNEIDLIDLKLNENPQIKIDQFYNKLLDLLENTPNFQFNIDQIYYFQQWYDNQENAQKQRFQKLLKSQQIQFLSSWVKYDAQMIDYRIQQDLIQLTQDYLFREFNIFSHVTIKPYFQAVTQSEASLLSDHGIDSIFIKNVGQQNKEKLSQNGELQLVWDLSQIAQDKQVYIQIDQFEKSESVYQYLFTKCEGNKQKINEVECLETINDKFVVSLRQTWNKHAKSDNHQISVPILIGIDIMNGNFEEQFKFISNLLQITNELSQSYFSYKIKSTISTFDDYLGSINTQQEIFPVFKGEFTPHIELKQCEDGCHTNTYITKYTGQYSNAPTLKENILKLYNYNNQQQIYLSLFAILALAIGDNKGLNVLNRIQNKLSSELTQLYDLDVISGVHSYISKRNFNKKINQLFQAQVNQSDLLINEFDNLIMKYSLNVEQDNLKELIQNASVRIPQKIKGNLHIKHVRVLNLELSFQAEKIYKLKLSTNKIHIIIDTDLEVLQFQYLSITSMGTQEMNIKDDQQYTYFFFLAKNIHPLSVKSYLLFEFDSQADCESSLFELKLDFQSCFQPNTTRSFIPFKKLSPEDSTIENDFLKITINLMGLLKTVQSKQSGLEYTMTQVFATQDGRLTHSDLQGISSKYQAQFIQESRVQRISFDIGGLFQCIRFYGVVTKFRDMMIHTTYCLHKKGQYQSIVNSNIKTFSGGQSEVIIRTSLESLYPDAPYKFYLDDSMRSNRQVFMDKESAVLRQMGVNDQSIHNEAYNSYPCNKGFIVQEPSLKTNIGFTFSHSTSCILHDKNQIDLVLSRSLFNTDINQKSMPRFSDLDISNLDYSINVGLTLSVEEHDDFLNQYQAGKQQIQQDYMMFIENFDFEKPHSHMLKDIVLLQNQSKALSGIIFDGIRYNRQDMKVVIRLKNNGVSLKYINKEFFHPLDISVKSKSLLNQVKRIRFNHSNETALFNELGNVESFETLYQSEQNECDQSRQDQICIGSLDQIEVEINLDSNNQSASLGLKMLRELLQLDVAEISQFEQIQLNADSSLDKKKKNRKKFIRGNLPIVGDQTLHRCLSIIQIGIISIINLIASLFLTFAILRKRRLSRINAISTIVQCQSGSKQQQKHKLQAVDEYQQIQIARQKEQNGKNI
ncbi:lysosomal alpha-mannosidase [Stylonychia lemnae]|uniref:Lysosomal alpha-mannosidase n=1 Tax=Stylonychia lemnae TaxID=5949 RepID=A0A078AIS4_STYLE|nr:lysosomal alpha-mannosidase [Stylonychia lemnae]|eukprot:CDW82185.1 lysosomal alpha-mannosidase [Stylonychia lemnae]